MRNQITQFTSIISIICIVLLTSSLVSFGQTCAPITLDCPSDITLTADPGACGESVNYVITLNGDCPLVSLLQTDGSGLTSGDYFPIGVTTQSWMSTDSMGNTDQCSFLITVVEFPDPITDDACNANINLSPDTDCEVLVTADMILEGGPYGCYDNYIVVLTTLAGDPVPNPITAAYIGQTISASVLDPSGNSCWGYIHYEDYIITPLHCGSTDINCRNNVQPSTDPLDSIPFPIPAGYTITPANGAGPFVVSDYDNCGDMSLSFVDNVIELDCTNGGPYTRTIYRTWTAIDGQGNSTSCVDTINLRVPTLSATNIFPDRDGTDAPSILCSGDWDANNDGIPQPEEIGDELNMLCDVWGEYTDYIHQLNCGVIIDRSWNIVNMCSGEFVSFIQKIRLVDDEAPVITCDAELEGSTNITNCYANYHVPHPLIEDDCSQVTYTVTSSAGVVVNMGTYDHPAFTINNLPIGWHTLTFTAIDGCGNQSSCTSSLHITDQVPPEARCENNLTIYLGAGQDVIDVNDINVYSSDACGIDYMKLRRVIQGSCDGTSYNDTQWHDFEEFCCEEAGQTILIELGVWDTYGNFSSCISHVFVESNIAPSLTCPPNITVSCSYEIDYDDLSIFGSVVTDPADVENIVIDDRDWIVYCKGQNYNGPRIWGQDGLATSECQFYISEQTDINTSCGKSIYENGMYLPAITRTFIISNAGGQLNSCTQKIYILDCNPGNTDIVWPVDVTLDACEAGTTKSTETGEPEVGASSCDEITTSQTDVDAVPNGDTCRHIVRHWVVSSTCAGGADSIIGEYDQNIYIIKTDDIHFMNCPDTLRAFSSANATELIFNGDFEMGDVGFTSDYDQIAGVPNGYIVATNPRLYNNDHACVDHTTGSGNMLIVDGSLVARRKVWCQEIQINVGVEYAASAWVNNLVTPLDNFADPSIEFKIEPLGIVVMSSGVIPEVPDEWIQLQGSWTATETRTIQLCASSTSPASIGNDFAIDDISFVGAVPGCDLNPDNGCEIAVDVTPPTAETCDTTAVDVTWAIDFDYEESVGFQVDVSGAGDIPNFLPFGTHQIKWLANDMCGGNVSCETVVILEDCEPPIAICEDIGVQVIQDTNGITIYADDITGMSIDNCGDVTAQFLICDGTASSSKQLYGLVDNTLIEIDTISGQISNEIKLTDDLGELRGLVFVPDEDVFYSISDNILLPGLVKINRSGIATFVGLFSLPGETIYSIESITYDPIRSELYASGNLDFPWGPGLGNKAESLLKVDRNSGNCEFVTTFSPSLGTQDIDKMEVIGDQLYASDGDLSLGFFSYLIDLPITTSIISPPTEFQQSFIGFRDYAYSGGALYTTTDVREFLKLEVLDGAFLNLGVTHTASEFNGKEIDGLAFVIDQRMDCHYIDSLSFDCNDLLNNPDTFSYAIVVTDAFGNADTCVGELVVADTNMVCEAPRCELIYAINSGGDYYSINTATGEFNLIAMTGVTSGTNAVAINDDLGIGYFASDQTVYWIDLVNGTVGTVATISVPGSLTAAAASYKNGYLYVGPEEFNQIVDIFRMKVGSDGKTLDTSPENLTMGSFPTGNFGDFVVMEGAIGQERMIMSVFNNVDGNRILEYLVASNSFTELSFLPSNSSSQITIDNVGNIWYFNNATSMLGIIDINTGVVTNNNVVPVLISDMGRSWCPPATLAPPSIYFPELVHYADVLQNHPNPFDDQTTIDFNLNEEEQVVLNIYTINGSLIERIEINGKRGLNSWILDRNLEAGTYLYQLQTAADRVTRRMVKVD